MSWHWPHYVVLFWQILTFILTFVGWWLADDVRGRPKYSWTQLIGLTAVTIAFALLFNWVLAQGGFWP